MKAASLKDIQTELENVPQSQMIALCLRLAKFKKENKELLSFLLFESSDEQAYIENIKQEINGQFYEINSSNLYFVKKSARKILRMVTKFSRYSGSAIVEVQLLLHFCAALRSGGFDYTDSQALNNIFLNQIKKIKKLIAGFHEDLQYDYLKELVPLLAVGPPAEQNGNTYV